MGSKRVAGICYLKMDGDQLPLGGSLTVSYNKVTRETVSGLSGVVGHKETPRPPFIEGEVIAAPEVSLKTIADYKNGTVVAELANGRTYTLHDATFVGDLDEDAAEGTISVRFEGTDMTE